MAVQLDLEHVSKNFPGVKALIDVSWNAHGGEVLALVGENGAGKSTLIKIMAGAESADTGTIRVDGQVMGWKNPSEALEHGIVVIYQELSVIPNVTVAENLYAGRWPRQRWGRIDRGALYEYARQLLAKVGLEDIDPHTAMSALSLAQQQLVEIAKALGRNARILIMDEPTSSLSPGEVERLFRIIRDVSSQGLLVLYVSHKMDEIFAMCSRAIVMRDGRIVEDRPIPAWSEEDLIKAMVSRDMAEHIVVPAAVLEDDREVVLAMKNFRTETAVSVAELNIRKQEIVGFAGLVGAGRSDVVEALAGKLHFIGSLRLFGKPVRWVSPRQAIQAGVVLVPENRQQDALIGSATVEENLTVALLDQMRGPLGQFRRRHAVERAREWAQRYGIPDERWGDPVKQFSGGMQQKVILSRVLATGPRILLLDEPTRGIDVGTKAEIYQEIRRLRDNGLTIIVVSSELPELFRVCDRIVVFSGKTMRVSLVASQTNSEEVMHYAAAKG